MVTGKTACKKNIKNCDLYLTRNSLYKQPNRIFLSQKEHHGFEDDYVGHEPKKVEKH